MKTAIAFILCALFTSFFTFAQPPILWQNTIGGSSGDGPCVIRPTSDGGYILGGESQSFISGDKTENPIGFSDMWIVKLNSLGAIQWQNTIGGNDVERVNSIEQTMDGGYIIGGVSLSGISGDKTEACSGWADYWIVKLDGTGNIQWENTIGGAGYEYNCYVRQAPDGGYLVAGSSDSQISGDKTENSLGQMDYWILKLDGTGNILWQNTIGGSGYDYISFINQTINGWFIIGGASDSDISGDKTENSNGFQDFWIVRVDSIGNIQWQNTIGGPGNEYTPKLHSTTGGGFILGGTSDSGSGGDKTEVGEGGVDYWVLKLDGTGNIQWQNTIGGSDYDSLSNISQTADGGYCLGGTSYSNISGDKMENTIGASGLSDYWILKLDNTGNVLWQNTIGGELDDYLSDILLTGNDGYLMSGYSYSNFYGDKNENCVGGADYWAIKLVENYNTISGKLYADMNNNLIQDISEQSLTYHPIYLSGNPNLYFSGNSGSYNVVVADTGNYSLTTAPINYYNSMPDTNSAYFPIMNQIDSLNNFAFQPAGAFNDLCITITPVTAFRPGQNASYLISYENVGTTTLTGTVVLNLDNDIDYVSSTLAPVFQTPDSVTWNVGLLNPFQSGNISVVVFVSAVAPIGSPVNSPVRIEPIAGDVNPGCNFSQWLNLVITPYDPNEILVNEDTIYSYQIPSPPALDYIIKFQNVGNDTAFNILVVDSLPVELDISTIDIQSSSHNITNIEYVADVRHLKFSFDNIQLPDSNVNELASHGFVRYRITPHDSLSVGDIIGNVASIYFDFNAAVITNIATTEIVAPATLESTILPTNISCNGLVDGAASVSISGGIPPYSILWSTGATNPGISNLSSGTYSVTVTDLAGEVSTTSVIVNEPSPLTATASSNDISCFGLTNGFAIATPSGGTLPYSFHWSNGSNNNSISNLASGTFTATITDASGCMTTASASVIEPALINASISPTDASCTGCADGAANLSVNGGTPPYTFTWSNTSTTEDISNVPAGNYSVSIVDQRGCSYSTSATITEPTAVFGSSNELMDFNLHPNPAEDFVICSFHLNESKAISIVLIDVFGKEIFQQKREALPSGNYEEKIDLNNLPSGVYSVWIKSESQSLAVGKLVVQ